MGDNTSKNNDLVILELDKPREIKFGVKAIKIIEKLKKCKISNLNLDQLTTDEIIQITHAGLIDKSITVEQLEDLIDEHTTVGKVIMAISEGFQVAFGKNDLTPEQQILLAEMMEKQSQNQS